MIIANPIYDVVFKYLLEDLDIAREFLSTIIGEEIQAIEIKAQETATEKSDAKIVSLSILRFDFKAVIKTELGTKKVLIELQKVKQAFDVMRFRRYLGDNYSKPDDVLNELGIMEKRPLPIVTIYFIGFALDNIPNLAIKVSREYRDAISGELIEVKEDFIELLTHDTFLIQLRKLADQTQTKLERVLQVFSPKYQTQDRHQLDFTGEIKDEIVNKMLKRLNRAASDENIRNVMDAEDEIESVLAREIKKAEDAKDKIIFKQNLKIKKERQKAEQERQKAEQERQKAEQERQKAEQERQKAEQKDIELKQERQKTEQERQKNEDLERQLAELKKLLDK